jgi:hypothetical protein
MGCVMATIAPKRLRGGGPKREVTKIQIDLSVSVLDFMIRYCVSDNSMITFKKLRDLKKLIEIIDVTAYETDREIRARIHVLEILLKSLIDHRIDELSIIYQKIREGRFGEEGEAILHDIVELQEEEELSNSQVMFIEEYTADRLNYSFIFFHQDALETYVQDLRTSNYDNLRSYCEGFKSLIGTIYKEMSSLTLMNKHAAHDFSTSAESLDTAFSTSITDLKKPSNIIKTGIHKLNEMLNGGFQSARTYLILGDTGGWKSGFLLNVVKWAVEHNEGIICDDPTCKPCVLYVT